MSFCLYTVATGTYAKMAENLILSIREHGVEYDFIALSDTEVKGATETIGIEPGDKLSAFGQKIQALEVLAHMGYDYLVYVDCDVLCLSPFSLDRFEGMPCFAILEDDIESAEGMWHGMGVRDVVSLFLSKNIDIKHPIHNLNGGFFGVRSELYDEFTVWNEAITEFPHTMEPSLSFAVHSMSDDLTKLNVRNNTDLMLPVVANQLVFGDHKSVLSSGRVEYMAPFSGWRTIASPSLAHFCFRDKKIVLNYKPKSKSK